MYKIIVFLAAFLIPITSCTIEKVSEKEESRIEKEESRIETVWNFDMLKDWSHNNVSDDPGLVVIEDGMLRISTEANTQQRKKAFSDAIDFKSGIYQWRVYVSDIGIGEKCSIGAFICKDDYHELDFEITAGKVSAREYYEAQDDEMLVYMTSQDNPWFQEVSKIKKNKWYLFEIDLSLIDDKYHVKWSIDNKVLAEVSLTYGEEETFRIYCSLENLNPFGDFLPLKKNYALFDYVKHITFAE